jgi:hypothetical protein
MRSSLARSTSMTNGLAVDTKRTARPGALFHGPLHQLVHVDALALERDHSPAQTLDVEKVGEPAVEATGGPSEGGDSLVDRFLRQALPVLLEGEREAEHRRQRRPQLVRHRGEDVLAELLDPPLLGDVLPRPEHLDRLLPAKDHAATAGHDALEPVWADDPVLERVRLAVLQGGLDRPVGELAIVWMDELEVGRVAQRPGPLAVEPEDPVELVRPPDEVPSDVPLPATEVGKRLRFP